MYTLLFKGKRILFFLKINVLSSENGFSVLNKSIVLWIVWPVDNQKLNNCHYIYYFFHWKEIEGSILLIAK